MSLWQELQRRKVFRVAAVYAVTAWILVQIVTAIAEPLSLPDWVDTFVIVVLGVGFPVALIFSWAFDVTPGGIVPASDRPAEQPALRPAAPSTHWLSHAGQLLILLAVAYLVADQFFLGDAAPSASTSTAADMRPEQRVSILLPVEHTAAFGWRPGHTLAISPDGRTIAYTASAWNDQSQIHHLAVREIASLEAREIPGSTDGGFQPFFSPDSRWIAFFTQSGQLKKAQLSGGAAVEIADGIDGGVWATGVWTDANEIVIRSGGLLLRVSAEGGAPELLGGENPIDGRWQGRPDYVSAAHAVIAINGRNLVAVDLNTSVQRIVLEDVDAARFVPTGHLVVQRDTAILLIPIDPATLDIRGDAVPLPDTVRGDGISGERGYAQFAVADNGDIVYARGGEARSELYAVARDGTAELLPLPADYYASVSLSPDGRTLAVMVDEESGGVSVKLLDVQRGTVRGLPPANRTDFMPQWRPDGAALVTYSNSPEGGGIFEHVLGGESGWLWQGAGGFRLFSWLPDQRGLVMTTGARDIVIMSLAEPEPAIEPLIATPASEFAPSVSPDGNWLAYISDEAGQPQLYIRRFPDGVDLPVSRDFAQGPVWARDSSELYFQGEHEDVLTLMAVKVTENAATGAPDLAALEPLFPLRTVSRITRIDAYRVSTDVGTTFDVLPDGRFIMPRSEDQTRYRELVLIQNLDLPARESAKD
jgi:Tol biopolymer transport system component